MSNFTSGQKLIYTGKDMTFIKNGDTVIFTQDSKRKGGEYCFIQAMTANANSAQVMVSDLTEEAEEASEEESNPRYVAFVKAHGKQGISEYMAFINFMAQQYASSRGEPTGVLYRPAIVDHADFTRFIQQNAGNWGANQTTQV